MSTGERERERRRREIEGASGDEREVEGVRWLGRARWEAAMGSNDEEKEKRRGEACGCSRWARGRK